MQMNTLFVRAVVGLVIVFLNSGCAAFPFYSRHRGLESNEVISVHLEFDPVVKDENNNSYFVLEDKIIAYGNELFRGCETSCKNHLEVRLRFIARSNSRNSKLFKAWAWIGVISLGIIPVVEKTTYTLYAEVKTEGKIVQIKKESEGYLVLHTVLLPLSIFRDWHDDKLAVQKNLLENVFIDIFQGVALRD